ncbi:ATP-dependent DNA ligase [Horticoccus luteus]|uniref:DNA ligase n=1 Tax=Horticoccus luteus TaxID=2862869 RepID=A0A8F9TZ09_9BACT|nr:ATP-dependent DNA ligase [Horticoccus luteus]QYM80132.1 ATP-dependent DNA ligase [Horticoccus luteus]
MAWDVQFRGGVWLPQIDWWLDAHFPAPRSFVSHAHFDHLALHREILCSAVTARLMRNRLPGERIEHILPFGQTEPLTPATTVTLHPAGHIFGSAQSLLVHERHGSLLYTGDFKLRPGRSAERCATPRADVLIMETTFGLPRYVFPPTAQVLADITAFCRNTLDDHETPVLFGYSLGKSQELLSSLADAQLPVMLHPQTLTLTHIYEELGLTFPPFRPFDASAVAGHVVICPPQARGSSFLKKISAPRTAVITGWAIDPGAVYRYQCDAAFPLSDHADYADLLRFVEAVQPQRVLTLHGFAQEFARTLRERGVEAWAIGQSNQLELGLASRRPSSPPFASSTDSPAESPAAAPPTPPLESAPPDRLAHFAATAERIKSAPGKLDKISLLRDYLALLAPTDAAHAAVFFCARPFPQADERVLTLGWSVLKRTILELSGTTEADYRAAYHRFADTGEAAAAILAGHVQPRGVALAQLAEFFAALAAARGPAAKLDLLREFLRGLSPSESKYVVKIITGDLRIGLKEGLVEEAIAASAAESVDAVREANMLSGDIAEVTHAARAHALASIQLRVFHPLQFMLASPEPTAEAVLARFVERAEKGQRVVPDAPSAPPPARPATSSDPALSPVSVWLEEKYDGIRCQLHKQGERVELYSRDLKRITGQFPELAAAAARLPHDFIGDGELLAWRDGRALPFAELQKRLGRKGDDFFLGAEIPVSISFYDLLWLDGRALLKEPLTVRREHLAHVLSAASSSAHPSLLLAPVQFAATALDIEAAFLAARQRGNEGLIAKDPASPYTPGRRGLTWLKLKKAYATLDVVVVGVEYGHGKRRDVLSDYTFAIRDEEHDNQLLTIGKAYSGLTDVEIAALTQHFLAHTLEVLGRYRTVVPDTVLEIAFDTIQRSSRHESGFALRFPRIARIRSDKTPAEIDTLATCRRLATAALFDPARAADPVAPPPS